MTAGEARDWALHLGMSALPVEACSALGAKLAGSMGRRRYPAREALARSLIARVRPAWSPQEVEAAVARLWDCTARTYAEFAVTHRILRHGRAEIRGREHLDAALAPGRPLVAMFLHTGNWELSFMQLAFLLPGRTSLIFDPPRSRSRAAIAHRVRSRAPWRLLPKSRMVWRSGLAALRRPGGILFVAADEDVEGRVGAPAFGRPLRLDGNLGKAARLAMRTGADILPFYNERFAGARFATHVLPPLAIEGRADDDGDVLAAVRRLDAIFDPPTRRLIDQWYMALMFRDLPPEGA